MLTKKRNRAMAATGRQKRSKRKAPKELFWVQPGHPDLDRAGDLLLSNLVSIRLESMTRGTAD